MKASVLYEQLNKRFIDYLKSLNIQDPFVKEHVEFKVTHTYHVVKNIREICEITGLPSHEKELAEVIALVHDIGRFQQFIRYHTFDDSISVNHAVLGLEVTRETGFFDGFVDEHRKKIIHEAVMNHNIFRLPDNMDQEIALHSKLIRDADKLDIWEILIDKDVVNRILDSNSIEKSYEVPDHILNCFRKQQPVPSGAVLMNDHRFLRLSWIYDMNFTATFRLIQERGYAEKILAKIPHSVRKDEIAEIISDYIRKKSMAPINLLS